MRFVQFSFGFVFVIEYYKHCCVWVFTLFNHHRVYIKIYRRHSKLCRFCWGWILTICIERARARAHAIFPQRNHPFLFCLFINKKNQDSYLRSKMIILCRLNDVTNLSPIYWTRHTIQPATAYSRGADECAQIKISTCFGCNKLSGWPPLLWSIYFCNTHTHTNTRPGTHNKIAWNMSTYFPLGINRRRRNDRKILRFFFLFF